MVGGVSGLCRYVVCVVCDVYVSVLFKCVCDRVDVNVYV